MRGRVFIDTNIMIYAHDLDSGRKHDVASDLLETIWQEETGAISTQVLQEFYVNVTRKIPAPLSPIEARRIIKNYSVWHVELIESEMIMLGSEIEEKYQLSFWDALIVAAASNAGAERIYTEDLSHMQKIETVVVVNPFMH